MHIGNQDHQYTRVLYFRVFHLVYGIFIKLGVDRMSTIKIDTHQHVFWHGRDDAGLILDMDENGIDLSWLLSWEVPPYEDAVVYHPILNPIHMRGDGTHRGIVLEDLIKARERYPERFIIGYCPHPMQGDASGLLTSAVRIHDVKICGEWKFRILFDDPRSIELFRTAGELGCPIVLHLDIPWIADEQDKMIYQPSWYGGTVDNLERALQACPDTVFIGHAPGFWREISGDAKTAQGAYPKGPVAPGGELYRLFETYENLYADLSAGSGCRALSRDPEHAVSFINTFSDRLLFARDIYGSELNTFLESIELSQDVRNKLNFQNALKLIPIDGVDPLTGERSG